MQARVGLVLHSLTSSQRVVVRRGPEYGILAVEFKILEG